MRNLSAAMLEAIHDAQTDEAVLTMVEIGDGVEAPLRLVCNPVNIVAGGYTYLGYPFKLELPKQSGEGRASQLIVDNVDRDLVRLVRELDEAPGVYIKIVLASDPDTIEMQLAGLRLRNADWDVGQVSGDLTFEDTLSEPAADTMTPGRFPGLF
jgi:hypothetical protein